MTKFNHLWYLLHICCDFAILVNPFFRAVKEGAKRDPNNYRPISVLPVISKLIERVVFDQFYEYLIVHDLLADTQSGFRPRHSTQTALLELSY